MNKYVLMLIGFLLGCTMMIVLRKPLNAEYVVEGVNEISTTVPVVGSQSGSVDLETTIPRIEEREVAVEYEAIQNDGLLSGKREYLRKYLLRTNGGGTKGSGMGILNDDGLMGQAFIEIYDLRDEEVKVLNDVMVVAKREEFALLRENTQVEQFESGSMRINMEAYGGEMLYNELLDGIQSVLGEEKYQDFEQLHKRAIGEEFGNFGSEQRVVELTKNSIQSLDENGALLEKNTYDVEEKIVNEYGVVTYSYSDMDELTFKQKYGVVSKILDEEERGGL